MSESPTTTPPTVTQPPGTIQWQMEMIRAIEELQIAQRNLGKGENSQFIDLVASRLMNNPLFLERLAKAVIDMTRANNSRGAPVAAATETIPGVECVTGEVKDIVEMPADDGGTILMQPSGEIHVQSGFIEFQGATHKLNVVMGMGEDNALVVAGGVVTYNGQRTELKADSPQGKALLNSLNASMRSLIETGAERIENFTTGRPAWFAMREYVYPSTLEA